MEMMRQIRDSLLYIDNHLEEPITVSSIADAAGYSEYHFSRCFKQEMQMSVMEYVKKRRLIKASDAILSGEKIIDAAFRFGWKTHSGFTRSFKNEFGFYPALLKAMMMQIDDLGGSAMSHIFLKNTDIHSTKEQLLERLKEEMISTNVDIDEEELQYVYLLACHVYEGEKRYSGDEYITHPLNVAIILAEMSADKDTIYAGMFCDAVQKTSVTIEQLKKELPSNTAEIVERLAVSTYDLDSISLGDEVLLVKLAERLHNMRTVEFMAEERRRIKAKETLTQIMPIAKKIGQPKLINELYDLSLKYLSVE